MSLNPVVLKFSLVQSKNCKTLTFKDLTGEYNVSSNPTGYPVEAFDPTPVAELTITRPDGTIVVLDISADGFPTIDSSVAVTLDSADLGLAANSALPDGIYTVKYKVTFSTGFSRFTTKGIVLTCALECCVHKMYNALVDAKSYCNNDELIDAMYGFSLLQDIQYEAECGSSTAKIQEMLDTLTDMCANIDCGCNCK